MLNISRVSRTAGSVAAGRDFIMVLFVVQPAKAVE